MSDKPQLIKVDMGPYASQIYKFGLFDREEHYMSGNNALKFLHFNNDEKLNTLSMSKRQQKLKRSRTVAVLALSPHAIKQATAHYAAIKFENDESLYLRMAIGVEKVSLDDNYSKAIGRDKAVKKMQEVNMMIIGLTMNENHIFLHLMEYEGVELSLRLNRKTGFSTVVGKMDFMK